MILSMQWGQKTVSNGGMGWEGRLHSQNPIVHPALLKEHKVVEHSTLFPRSHDAKCACSSSSGSLHTHQPTHFIHLLQAQGKYYKLLSTSTHSDLFPTGNQLWLNLVILTAPFWYDTLLGALAPSKFSNPNAINPDKKWTPKTPPKNHLITTKKLQLLKLKTGDVTKDNGKHWLTENKGEMAENLEDVCAHTHLHKQETEREKRKSRECSPKKAGTHQVSDLDISFETSYIDQTMWMHDNSIFPDTITRLKKNTVTYRDHKV